MTFSLAETKLENTQLSLISKNLLLLILISQKLTKWVWLTSIKCLASIHPVSDLCFLKVIRSFVTLSTMLTWFSSLIFIIILSAKNKTLKNSYKCSQVLRKSLFIALSNPQKSKFNKTKTWLASQRLTKSFHRARTKSRKRSMLALIEL